MTYTPGPWTSQKSLDLEKDYAIRGPDGGILGEAYIHGAAVYEELVDVKANARLMAAAPALLEELRRARIGLRARGAHHDNLQIVRINVLVAQITHGEI